VKHYCKIFVSLVFISVLALGCAPTRTYTPTTVPGWESVRGEFREPPLDLSPGDQRSFEVGWNALIDDDLESAVRELEKLGRRYPDSSGVDSALGYLELRLGERRNAEIYFTSALLKEPSLASAQAGSFLTALADGREEVAFERLRLLREDHPGHSLVGRYLSTLQLKLAESKLQTARSLRREGQNREAAEEYRETLRIAPESGRLYAETAEVEMAAGEFEAAAAHAAKALELEPDSVDLYRLRGDAHRAMGDLEAAVEAYGKARALRPEDLSLAALHDETRRELERESLPVQFSDIASTRQLTREQLAALLFVKLRPVLGNGPSRINVIATDIGDSWAGEFIRQIVAAEILHVFPNHTFQPRASVRKSEMATALAAAIDRLGPAKVNASTGTQPVIEDVSPENLNYRSISLVVSLGLLPIDEGGRFHPLDIVSGAEATDAVEELAERVFPQ
jgi:tetratricopeptide (TPR) repeat protein